MALKVHHLNCATMCPLGAKWLSHTGDALDIAPLVCHCLLIETNEGLILIDTGYGLQDIAEPKRRLGRAYVAITNSRLDESETAIRQIEKLGFKAEDVNHIILTHLDIDHGGGLSDFPFAKVHLYENEYQAVISPTFNEKRRYNVAQWEHGPLWRPHKLEGEVWNGFEGVRLLNNISPDIILIPLIGHSRGHCGVAVNSESGWLFHCGDAFFHHHQIDHSAGKTPPLLLHLQKIIAFDNAQRLENLRKIVALNHRDDNDVSIFCSHDHQEFYCLQQGMRLDHY
jgi:glyoxylase-like metal-dependent hydrolase (beta-lactamase superfamily II)